MYRVGLVSIAFSISCSEFLDEDAPSPPTELRGFFTVVDKSPKVKLKWELSISEDIEEYHIFRSNNNGLTFNSVSKISSSNFTFDDTSITWQENLIYKIRCKDRADNLGEFSDSILVNCYGPGGNWAVQGFDSLFLCIDPVSHSSPEMFQIDFNEPLLQSSDTSRIMSFSETILDTVEWQGNGWMYLSAYVIEESDNFDGHDTVLYNNIKAPEYYEIVLSEPNSGIISFSSGTFDPINLSHNLTSCDGMLLFP